MKDSNFVDLQYEIEECFHRYSVDYIWQYMQNRDEVSRLYPKLVNELYDIINKEKSKIESE